MSARRLAWAAPIATMIIAGLGFAAAFASSDPTGIWLVSSFAPTITTFGVVGGLISSREVDLDSLTGELRWVVAETMQPAHVTLWVRPTEPTR